MFYVGLVIPGQDGDQGEPGPQGEMGPVGENGFPGRQGPAGYPGANIPGRKGNNNFLEANRQIYSD